MSDIEAKNIKKTLQSEILDSKVTSHEQVSTSKNFNTRDDYKHFSHPLNSIGYLIGLISFLVSFFAIYYFFATLIDFYFPDPTPTSNMAGYDLIEYLESFFYNITSSLAAGIVATPLYVVILFLTRKHEIVYPLLRISYSRRIHVFAILIVTFVSIVGSAIVLVYNLLSGNFSIGNILNFLALFTISIVPFIYYLLQIKDDSKFKN